MDDIADISNQQHHSQLAQHRGTVGGDDGADQAGNADGGQLDDHVHNSLEDLVEEIFGDIEDEHDNTSYISKQIDEREYVLSARLEIEKVNETYGLDLPESDDYLTVGGLILNQYQSFPKLHEVVRVGRYQFKIIKVTATKIELVRLKVLE